MSLATLVVVLLLLPVSASTQPLPENVNPDDEGDMFEHPVLVYPAFLDIIESSIGLTGDPGEEALILRMTVAEPIGPPVLPGPTSLRRPPNWGLEHPAVKDVVWRFAFDTDQLSAHAGFPYPPGPDTRPQLVITYEYFVDVTWDRVGGLRADFVTIGVGPTHSLSFEIGADNDRGVIEVTLPVPYVGGMDVLSDLTWLSGVLVAFDSPCTPNHCLRLIADLNEPELSFELSE
jgi:hypothetical protein